MPTTTLLTPGFASRIDGIDAASASGEDIEYIRDALKDQCVLLLQGQSLDETQQAEFAARFGTLDSYEHMSSDYSRGLRNDLLQVSNLDEEGHPVEADDRRRVLDMGNKFWHTDSSFKAVPAHLSMLYGISVTREGGETQFADMRAAWESLTQDWKDLVEGLVAEHSAFTARRALGFDDFSHDYLSDLQDLVGHDIVRTLPETGRKTLYLSSHATRIAGMPVPVGRMLLMELTELATLPDNIYSHQWQKGDLVIWDNRCTMHRMRRYRTSEEQRMLRRATTLAPEFSASDTSDVCVPEWKINAAA